MFCLVGRCCRCCSGGGCICARSIMLSAVCGAGLVVIVVSQCSYMVGLVVVAVLEVVVVCR